MARLKNLLLTIVGAAAAATASGQVDTASASGDIVSASTLTRTHTVLPAWPATAPEGVAGWVMLRFTVQPDGAVTDIEITGAEPAGIFESSATEALRQWKYEPVQRDGKKIAQRAEIRISYAQPG